MRVNCVAPGPVWTPLNPADRDEEKGSKFGSDVPMGRPAQPEEIAPAYVIWTTGGGRGAADYLNKLRIDEGDILQAAREP